MILVAAVLVPRLWRLESRSIWYDEAASWRTVSLPVPEMLKSLAANVHPPLYFFALKFWCSWFGDSEIALRGLSVLGAVAAAIAVGGFAACGSDEPESGHEQSSDIPHGPISASSDSWTSQSDRVFRAMLAVTLYGSSALAVRYAREARMYTLATVFVVSSAWLLVEGLRRRKLGYQWASALLLAAGAYTHYYVLIHCVAQGLYVLFQTEERRWRHLLPIAFFPAFALVPWAGVLISQAERVGERYWIGPLTWERAGNLLMQLWTADDGDSGLWRSVAGTIVFVCGIGASWRWGNRVGRLAAWHAVVTFMLAAYVSTTWKSIAVARYFVPAHALLLCGLVSAWPARHWIGRAFALNALAALLVLLIGLWPRLVPPTGVDGMRGAVAWVAAERSLGDIVLVERPFLYLPWRYYDRVGPVYLTDAAASRLTHYEGLALLTAVEQQAGTARASEARSVWYVSGGRSSADHPVRAAVGWTLSTTRRFHEAFPWQSPIVVEHWVRNEM